MMRRRKNICADEKDKWSSEGDVAPISNIYPYIHSMVTNYIIICWSPLVFSFSAGVDFREKQSLFDHMCSNILYLIMKLYFSIRILSLRTQMFPEIGQFSAVPGGSLQTPYTVCANGLSSSDDITSFLWVIVYPCHGWHKLNVLRNYEKVDACHGSYRVCDITSLSTITSFSVLSFLFSLTNCTVSFFLFPLSCFSLVYKLVLYVR
jgi:hypothetical protein